MIKKFAVPRGASDILPEEIFIWREMESKLRKILNLYGYKEIRTPLFEETELFARSVGQTSDIVQKQMLNLAAQPKPGEKSVKLSGLSLRPEGTASVVRSYIQNGLDRKERLSKLFYIGPMFRGERPQKGRLRQFSQIGVEAIGPGSSSAYLDAEVISLSVNILKALGIKDFKLKINSLGSSEDKKEFAKVLKKQLGKKIKDLCSDCQQRFERNVFRILDCKNKECKEAVRSLKLDYSFLSAKSFDYYSQVKEALKTFSTKFEESIDLVRGLDYYTHVVFEISSAHLGSQDALGAGGRYSNLVAQLGGPSVDAVGFALGMERILLSMPKVKPLQESGIDVFLICLDENITKKAVQILEKLRRQDIAADMSYQILSLKSQMRSADKSGARFALILGEDEDKRGIVALKCMQTGNQKEIKASPGDINSLVDAIKKKGC